MVGSLPRSPAVSGWLILPIESITDVVLSELSGSCTLRGPLFAAALAAGATGCGFFGGTTSAALSTTGKILPPLVDAEGGSVGPDEGGEPSPTVGLEAVILRELFSVQDTCGQPPQASSQAEFPVGCLAKRARGGGISSCERFR
jgi:hypothetical protein